MRHTMLWACLGFATLVGTTTVPTVNAGSTLGTVTSTGTDALPAKALTTTTDRHTTFRTTDSWATFTTDTFVTSTAEWTSQPATRTTLATAPPTDHWATFTTKALLGTLTTGGTDRPTTLAATRATRTTTNPPLPTTGDLTALTTRPTTTDRRVTETSPGGLASWTTE